jgi:hypothetical protein
MFISAIWPSLLCDNDLDSDVRNEAENLDCQAYF